MHILEAMEQDLKAGHSTRTSLAGIDADFRPTELQRGEAKNKEVAQALFEELQLLSIKPIIYVFNCSEKQIQEKWQPGSALKRKVGSTPFVTVSAKIESELSELAPDEKKEFLEGMGISQSSIDQLIKTGYETLGLMTFLTTGEDETRAWTVPAGSLAPRAGRAIHSDFEQKFIRAEVIAWDKLLEAGSYARARELGLLRIEGKNYAVRDGDVIEFKI